MRLIVDVPDNDFAALEGVAKVVGLSPEAVVRELLERVADGARRPKSWERSWLQQALPIFGQVIPVPPKADR